MAGTRSSSRDDRTQAGAPSGMATWLADHRTVARVVLVVVDLVVLALAIAALGSSGRHWTAFVVLAVWLGLTVSFGWATPQQVDAWRRRGQEAQTTRDDCTE